MRWWSSTLESEKCDVQEPAYLAKASLMSTGGKKMPIWISSLAFSCGWLNPRSPGQSSKTQHLDPCGISSVSVSFYSHFIVKFLRPFNRFTWFHVTKLSFDIAIKIYNKFRTFLYLFSKAQLTASIMNQNEFQI